MLDPETKRKIRELGVPGMMDIMEMLCNDSSYAGLSFEEKIVVAVDYMHQEASNEKVARLIRNAKLRFSYADITNIDYDGRPIKRELVSDLGTTRFVANSGSVPNVGVRRHRLRTVTRTS